MGATESIRSLICLQPPENTTAFFTDPANALISITQSSWHGLCISYARNLVVTKTAQPTAMQELAVLSSRVLTAQRQFNATADNIANVSTNGYRKLDMDFKETISRPRNHVTASYVEDRAVHVSADQGALNATGNPMDLAIGGEGFFAVRVNGTIQYTRRGQFILNNENTLVTPEGNPVLDNSGAEIQIPENTTQFSVGEDGTVSTEQGQLGQVGVYTFTPDDLKKLERAGNTAFVPMLGATAQVVEAPIIKQGFIEASNVNAVTEMVNMQSVTQAYENSVKLMKGLEDMESQAIRTLGSTN